MNIWLMINMLKYQWEIFEFVVISLNVQNERGRPTVLVVILYYKYNFVWPQIQPVAQSLTPKLYIRP